MLVAGGKFIFARLTGFDFSVETLWHLVEMMFDGFGLLAKQMRHFAQQANTRHAFDLLRRPAGRR